MTAHPRVTIRSLSVLVLGALLTASAPAGAQTPNEISRHRPGLERIPRPALPSPVPAGDGAVYVPAELRELPCLEFDDVVRDATVFISAGGDQLAGPGANVRVNNTALDPPGITNSETTIAVLGQTMVAAWNDGKNLAQGPGLTGYAYSSDGGLTWTDGGVPPVPGPSARHLGDPVMTVDGAGHFYLADLYTPDNVYSAVAVTRGSFSGASFSWNPPVMVAYSLSDFLDKEWLTADPVSGNLYCTWTRFLAAGGNLIEFSRSTSGGANWTPPAALTIPALESVQGSRVAVGPDGELQVIYIAFDRATGNNYMRGRRSTDQGVTWGPEITLPAGPNGILSNYGSGPAGFNRSRGIGLPALTIDRTAGPNRGRVYATWEETINFYYDPLGTLGPIGETEFNGDAAAANPIAIGQSVNGNLSGIVDQDFYSFTGAAGQTVILYLVPAPGSGADGYLRLHCGGGAVADRVALSYFGNGTGLIVYTLPVTGTYYLGVFDNSATVGDYIVYTGFDVPNPGSEVARDTRDAIVQSSPDGVTWDTRRIVNDDPALYDNAFPEVAVDGLGQVFVNWYDHRADVCGIGTDLFYARSPNGSVSFLPSNQLNDGPHVNWNLVSSNIAPNMGDYSALVAEGCHVYACFADGRQGTPDAWLAAISDCATPALISLVQAQAGADGVDLRWHTDGSADLVATVERREEGSDWGSIGTVSADGAGLLRYLDATVRAGTRYGYRLNAWGASGRQFFGEVWLDVPVSPELAILPAANPVRGELEVTFTTPAGRLATLELLDIAGRRIESARVSGTGRHTLGGTDLKAGVYVIRLVQQDRSVSTTAVVVR